jgi:iron complex transport system ATP-binding protein/vitamin B12 transport system ATP-binding protein
LLIIQSVSLINRLVEISLQANRQQWWMLLGPNGAGKSSLLTLAAGLESPSSGELMLDQQAYSDVTLGSLAVRRCLVTQAYRTEFSISVKEILWFFTHYPVIPDQIEQHLEIASLCEISFDSLSGGEKQRVHLARNLMQVWAAIEQGNALVLLDEPLQQMDIRHQIQALLLIEQIQQMGNTIVMSHHDINQTLQYASHACLIDNGQVMRQGAIDEVITLESMQILFSQSFRLIQDEALQSRYFVAQ